jgi:hypothetical protein
MHLPFTDEEYEILTKLINREISDLGTEIRRTDAHDYRDDLKVYRRQHQSLSEKMAPSHQDAALDAGV